MTRLSEPRTIQLSAIAALDGEAERRETRPAWLRSLAVQAGTRFVELGLPTRKHEEWRLTDVTPIAETSFRLSDDAPPLSAAQIAPFEIPGLTGSRLVFVNGIYAPALSSLSGLPKDAVVASLREAIESHPDALEQHLGRYADAENDAFTALNTAMIGDGLFVHIPKRTVVAEPIHILNITAAEGEPLLTSPRNLIIVDEGAQATIIEDYVSLVDDDVYFTNAVTEIVIGDNARAEHYLLERESEEAFNISTLRIQQRGSSDFASHSVMLGGSIVRNNVVPVLDGEHCESLLNGLYLTAGTQHVDNHMRVVHAKPHCDSRQFYRGVLSDQSTAVFSGRIVVVKDAQKTDAKQSNANLLLSDACRVNTHPQLEIYADDVKCTHGATIGEMDENAVFYLRSRGLSEAAARGLLIHAFAGESLERMKVDAIREFLEDELLRRLPEGKLVRESMQA